MRRAVREVNLLALSVFDCERARVEAEDNIIIIKREAGICTVEADFIFARRVVGNGVIARTVNKEVVTLAASENVIAFTAVESISTLAAFKRIVTIAAAESISTFAARESIGTLTAGDLNSGSLRAVNRESVFNFRSCADCLNVLRRLKFFACVVSRSYRDGFILGIGEDARRRRIINAVCRDINSIISRARNCKFLLTRRDNEVVAAN